MNTQFRATLQKSPAMGGWTYVVMPGSAEFFGTKGLVKVRGTVDDHPFQSSDPSGFRWEIATNPGWSVGPGGKVALGPI